MPTRVDAILDQFAIPDCRYCYLHVSLSGLGLPIRDYNQLLEGLRSRLPDGCTIVVPSFPFGNNVEYAALLDRGELDFDVDRTPCRVNLFGEMFRRRTDVLRTWNPILPVACLGQDAQSLCDTCHLDVMPFDDNSIFGRLTRESSCVIGLGVDTNTNSFAHMADDQFADRFPCPLYTPPQHCRVHKDGRLVHEGEYKTVTVELRRKIKPGLLQPSLMGKPFFQWVDDPAQAYCIELTPFVAFMSELAEKAFNNGVLPPWHKQ